MIILGFLLNLFSLFLRGASIVGLFGFIHYLQMIIIIPMIGAYISHDVTTFIATFGSCLLNFNFILKIDLLSIQNLIDIDYPQKNSYLDLIELASGSGLINLQASILLFMVYVCIGIIVMIAHAILLKYELSSRCLELNKFLYKILIFNVYIRFIIESFILYCLA